MAHADSNGVQVVGKVTPEFAQILTPEALAFVAKLERNFRARRLECLQRRQDRQARLDRGEALDFLPETKHIRDGDWKCAPIPRGHSQIAASKSPARPIAKW